ncbi:MAG: hypothetical protein WD266_08510 [Balneolales bacterium]
MNRLPRYFAIPVFCLSLVSAVLFLSSGYGYQWEIWSLATAFSVLTYSAFAAIGLLPVSTAGLLFGIYTGRRQALWMPAGGFVLTAVVAGVAFYWQTEAASYPPIHDISTDTAAPLLSRRWSPSGRMPAIRRNMPAKRPPPSSGKPGPD